MRGPVILGKVYAVATVGTDPTRGVQPMVYAIAAEGLHRFIPVSEDDQPDLPWVDDWYLGEDPAGASYSQIEFREEIGWNLPKKAVLGLWSEREADLERLRTNKQRGSKAAATRKEREEQATAERVAAQRAARAATPQGRLQEIPEVDHVFKWTDRRSGDTQVMAQLLLTPDRFREVMKWVQADSDLVEEFLVWDKNDEEI